MKKQTHESSLVTYLRQAFMFFRSGHLLQGIDVLSGLTFEEQELRDAFEELDDPWVRSDSVEDWMDLVGESVGPESVLMLGLNLQGAGEETLAEEAFRISSEQGNKDALVFLAVLLLGHGKNAWATDALHRCLLSEDRTGDLAAHFLGIAHAQEFGFDDKAMALLERGRDALYGNSQYWYGKALVSKGEYNLGLQWLKKAMGLGDWDAPIELGNLLRDEFAEFEAAEEAYRIGVEREDTHSMTNLGLMLLDEFPDRREEAESLLNFASALGDELARKTLDDLKD